jgi:hypothetical protein
MRFIPRKSSILFLVLLATLACSAQQSDLPQGIILNLDLQHIHNGLIPNKTLYPLYVPLGELRTRTFHNRTVLEVKKGQGLEIPHSSLLDPDGRGWVATIRIFAKEDGNLLSQSNGEQGYVIQINDGAVQATIQTGEATVVLQESAENGITDCRNKWITIDLQILPEMAILSLNRARVAVIPLTTPLSGKELRIHLGEPPNQPGSGFFGAISSLKILRS